MDKLRSPRPNTVVVCTVQSGSALLGWCKQSPALAAGWAERQCLDFLHWERQRDELCMGRDGGDGDDGGDACEELHTPKGRTGKSPAAWIGVPIRETEGEIRRGKRDAHEKRGGTSLGTGLYHATGHSSVYGVAGGDDGCDDGWLLPWKHGRLNSYWDLLLEVWKNDQR